MAGLAGRELNLSGLVGAVWGVGAAGIYHWNRRRKAERNQRVSAGGALLSCSGPAPARRGRTALSAGARAPRCLSPRLQRLTVILRGGAHPTCPPPAASRSWP